MKEVILSADGPSAIYIVPDIVADNLHDYCLEFCCNWLRKSPFAAKYRRGNVLCYNEQDFIDYLNEHIFPQENSVLVQNLGYMTAKEQKQRFKDVPAFNF